MNNEEKIRLVLETLGVENVRQASRAIREMAASADSLEGEMEQLAKTVRDGVEAPMERFLVTLKNGQKVWNDSAEGIRHLGQVAGKTAGRRGVRDMSGQDIMALSYAIDDLQYGFAALSNNIPRVAQSFGLGAGAAGALSIAVIGISSALRAMQSVLGDTEAEMKPFSEVLGDFAKGMGASNIETQKLTAEIDKLSKQAAPGWLTELTGNLPKIRDAIQAQKELIAAQKESQEENAKREAFNKRIEEEGKNKDAAKQVDDALQGMGPDGQVGLAKRLARDKMGAARGELMDEQLAAMEAAGNFGDIRDPIFGAAIPFLNRGGTGIGRSRAVERAAKRREEAKAKLERDMSFDSEETRKKAESIAGGTIEKARAGDPQAIAEIEAISPEVANLIKWDADDAKFQGSLTDRSKAVANRDAIRAKRSIEQANNPQIPDALRLQRQFDIAQEDAGIAKLGTMLPNGAMWRVEQDRRILQERAEAEAKEKARQDILTGLAPVLPDPETLAAVRRGNAGFGVGAVQRMKFLESQDMNALFGTFKNAGMSDSDAKRSVNDYMQQGNDAFAEFAKANGMNANNLNQGFRASQALLQKIMQDNAETQEIVQWLQAMANMQGQTTARPPSRVRN